MGQPVKIMDLALRMVQLSGLSVRDASHPDGDIEIAVTGLRPGEKLYEELLIGDNPEPTAHPRIMKAHEDCLGWDVLQPHLLALRSAAETADLDQIRAVLLACVQGYRAASIA
jgi:FlaA1/EpsC-like NDP-sugar epimerase